MTDGPVLIAGGGPVGLFSALLLGRQGIEVKLFEANPRLLDDPRAATTHPATLEIMGAAGLAEDMARVGLVAPIVQFWDRPSGEKIAEFDHTMLAGETDYPFVVQCEQFKTSQLILERLRALPNVEVMFDHEVIGATQDGSGVKANVRTPDGVAEHQGAWLIGADGGRSTVRKAAGISFDGFTWPERFIVLTTTYDFGETRGYCPRSYFADPEAWCNCFKISGNGPPGLWRTVFPTDPKESDDSLMSDEGVQARLQKFFPAPQPYEVVHRNLYVTHQRVASRFRVGRIVLAGDAAHVNNPIGGMGLNGGLQDAANLSEKLSRIVKEGADERLLDLYDLQRRTVAVEFVQAQSIANKKRLEERDPEQRWKNLMELRQTAADPARAKGFLMRSAMITSQRRVAAMTLEEARAS